MNDIIKTDNLILRKHNEDDFERYWGMLNEQVMWNPEAKKNKLNYSECLESYRKRINEPFSEEGADFAVIAEKNKYVGRCGFSLKEKGAELYYMFCMDSWGRGYTYETLEAVLGYLFDHFTHRQYYINIDESDAAKVKICKRVGFEKLADGVYVVNKIE